jgi:hypothetical protein
MPGIVDIAVGYAYTTLPAIILIAALRETREKPRRLLTRIARYWRGLLSRLPRWICW